MSDTTLFSPVEKTLLAATMLVGGIVGGMSMAGFIVLLYADHGWYGIAGWLALAVVIAAAIYSRLR